MVSKFGALA